MLKCLERKMLLMQGPEDECLYTHEIFNFIEMFPLENSYTVKLEWNEVVNHL